MNTTLTQRLGAALHQLVHATLHQQHEARQWALEVLAELEAARATLPTAGPHTAAPWVASCADPTRIMAGGYIVAECESGIYASHKFAGRENARRIIACANACEGITTEDLEALNRKSPGRLTHANNVVRSLRIQLGARVADGVDPYEAGEVIVGLAGEIDAYVLSTAPSQLPLQGSPEQEAA